jgi:hypothetical protein
VRRSERESEVAQRDFSQMVAAGTGPTVHFEGEVVWKWTRLGAIPRAAQSYHCERYRRLMVVDDAVDIYSD